LFFWFPKLFGRSLNEPLGKIHFWLTFAGVYCVFMPMHWLGLISQASKSSGANLMAIAALIGPARTFITGAILVTVFTQGVFLFNFLRTLLRGERAEEYNPWRASTLEWSATPTPEDDFGVRKPIVYRGAYELSVPGIPGDFIPQDLDPDQVAKAD